MHHCAGRNLPGPILVSGALQFAALADAWDCIGDNVLMPVEREALCALAGIDPAWARRRWRDLSLRQHDQVILATRRAVEVGAACALALLRTAQVQT